MHRFGHQGWLGWVFGLVLCDCGLQHSAVNTIAASLKRLKQLKLDCNPGEDCSQL
jgi:hypothetical protein